MINYHTSKRTLEMNSYLIEIRHHTKINRFGLGEEIKDCEKKEVKELKKLYEVIAKLVKENSTW